VNDREFGGCVTRPDRHVSGKTLDVEFEEPFLEALEQAVTPSDADVMVARGVVLDMLAASDEPVLLTAFEDAWRLRRGAGGLLNGRPCRLWPQRIRIVAMPTQIRGTRI